MKKRKQNKRNIFIVAIVIIIILLVLFISMAKKQSKKETDLSKYEVATLAGGCFWCTEAGLEALDGVAKVVSGYAGGTTENPTYEEVYSETTGHKESVQVYFDPKIISYEELLGYFWRSIDPTDSQGQFTDRGESYTTAIFYHDNEQKVIAEKTKKELEDSGKFDNPIATKIIPFTNFYMAEDYHQDYAKKRTLIYEAYKAGSGRNSKLPEIWQE